jgi:hypothetical protein
MCGGANIAAKSLHMGYIRKGSTHTSFSADELNKNDAALKLEGVESESEEHNDADSRS